ncbi:MAG: Gfo/Idh/MocA family oxidoreductase [Gemmatimonadaceae bacterium]|nr:Gfo/Idh/MocA family oxidoreductase [Gemmatimonadaceae bacterium]
MTDSSAESTVVASSRRTFIKQSAAAVTGATLGAALPPAAQAQGGQRRVAPSDQVNLAVIGAKGMGWSDARSHLKIPGVNLVALADVDRSVLTQRSEDARKLKGTVPRTYDDYRKMLESKDIDAVIVGTPDHWHCLAMVESLAAGKHVYVEKPIAHTIEECQVMQAATRRYGKMVQVGQWQRSGTHYANAIEYVRSGKLGKIRVVKVWAYQGWMKPVAVQPDSAPPAGVNYAMWLGPAPKRPFNPNRFHFNFRWFWDYAGGLMTDWGVHEIDIALYAMNVSAPKSVVASGGKFAYPDDASETPDTLQAVFEYDGFTMLWEHATGIDGGPYGRPEGIAFVGNNGTLVVNRGGWEVLPEVVTVDGVRGYRTPALPMQYNNEEILDRHTLNFVEAIRKNDASGLACGIDTGSVAAINASMGNIALRTGRKVHWDAAAGRFTGDAEANAMIGARYQNGYVLPTV